jgi:hypothetical protein
MRGVRWLLGVLLGVGVLLSIPTGGGARVVRQKPDLTQLEKLHYMASMVIADGQKNLDDPIPSQVRSDFTTQVPLGQDGTVAPVTYRELIVRSEQVIVQAGSRVTVSIDAQPHSCDVTYRPIAGGGTISFGTTLATQRVEPRTYEFTCSCTSPPRPRKVVDCTEDQKIQFECKQ